MQGRRKINNNVGMVFGKKIDGYGFYAMELVRKWIYGFAMDMENGVQWILVMVLDGIKCNGYRGYRN